MLKICGSCFAPIFIKGKLKNFHNPPNGLWLCVSFPLCQCLWTLIERPWAIGCDIFSDQELSHGRCRRCLSLPLMLFGMTRNHGQYDGEVSPSTLLLWWILPISINTFRYIFFDPFRNCWGNTVVPKLCNYSKLDINISELFPIKGRNVNW